MASNSDIISLLSTEADQAVDQIIADSKRLHTIVNGTGTEQAVTEDGSLIPSVRKALLENLYFKTPPLAWRNGGSVTEYNQIYTFTDVSGNTTWWYAPGATVSNPVVMKDSPINDGKFRVFLDKTNISEIYAPLLSPDFKGNPRVPLAAEGDNSNSIASTMWVQGEMENLRDQIVETAQGEFENITVHNDAVLKDLYVDGEFIVNSSKLDALNTEATLRRIRMVGTGTGAGEIAFEQNGSPPVGISTKTNIKPYAVATGMLTSDKVSIREAKVGDVAVSTDSLDVDGFIRGDYLHLEGNNRHSSEKPQLVVDGIAEIGTLRVTGSIEGVKADVDGLNINPNSVQITNGLQVGTDTTMSGKLTVTGNTKVSNLEVTGNLTGVAINVDGKDISPRSINTGNIVSTGSLQISGTTTATGKITTQDLEVLGTLTANLDLSGSDLSVDNIGVAQTATIKDLVVTGTTSGVTADVEGKLIKPSRVEAGSISTEGNADIGADLTVGGDLSVTGSFQPGEIDTGSISGSDLHVSGDITQTSGTTRVVNLEVTGTTTGVTATVDGEDITPHSVTTAGSLSVGTNATVTGTLGVSGKATFGDVDFTGVATGLTVDLSGQNITVKSIGATDPSSFGNISTNNITNGTKITTQDIQVNGDILDADGNPVNTFDVTGKDILPNSVQSATSVKTNTLEVEQTSNMKGAVTLGNGLTVTDGNILAPTGQATFNNVQVNGFLTDSDGNSIGSVESIKGKLIEPRAVVADESVEAPSIESTGPLSAANVTVSGGTSTGTLSVNGLTNAQELRLSGPLIGKAATVNSLVIDRLPGSDETRLTVEGDSSLQGDLFVSGTISGTVDLSSQDVSMNSLHLSQDLTARNVTCSATVTGSNGVFGNSSQTGTEYGLQSLSSAKVETDLDVGGTLTAGTLRGNFDMAGKTISPSAVTATTGTFADLVVTGTVDLPESPIVAESITAGSVESTGNMVAGKYATTPKDVSATTSTFTPDGTTSIYNLSVQEDTEIQAPTGLLTSNKGESLFIYLEQDTVGHAVTFSSAFVVHNDGVVSPEPNSITIANLVYRGKGSLIDVFLAGR